MPRFTQAFWGPASGIVLETHEELYENFDAVVKVVRVVDLFSRLGIGMFVMPREPLSAKETPYRSKDVVIRTFISNVGKNFRCTLIVLHSLVLLSFVLLGAKATQHRLAGKPYILACYDHIERLSRAADMLNLSMLSVGSGW